MKNLHLSLEKLVGIELLWTLLCYLISKVPSENSDSMTTQLKNVVKAVMLLLPSTVMVVRLGLDILASSQTYTKMSSISADEILILLVTVCLVRIPQSVSYTCQ